MKYPSYGTGRSLLLLCSVSAVTMLSACDWLGIGNPLSDDQRPKQMVEGGRHAPLLNPDTVPPTPEVRPYVHGVYPPQEQPIREGINPDYYDNEKAQVAPTPVPPPAVVAPVRAPAAAPSSFNAPKSNPTATAVEEDPYDTYDASGNVAEAPAPASEPAQGNFFDRLFGSSSSKQNPSRRPLSNNPYYSNMSNTPPVAAPASAQTALPVQKAAPLIATAPELKTPPVVAAAPSLPAPSDTTDFYSQEQNESSKNNHEAQTDSSAATPTDISPPPVVAAQKVSLQNAADSSSDSSSSDSSWFGRWIGRHSGNEDDPARKEPTPALSSVPPTPPQFQAIKDQKLQEMQDLQGDRIEAVQEKQQLDSEPSQQQPMVPVADTPPPGAIKNQSDNQPANADQPVVLGHIAAPPDSVTTVSGLKVPASTALPPPVDPVKEPSDDYVSALQHINTSSAVSAPVGSVMQPPVVSAQPSLVEPPPAVSASQAQPADNDSPLISASSSTTIMIGDQPLPKQDDDAAASAIDAALPSPQLLETVTASPQSRYSNRGQALPQQQPAQ